MPRRSRWLTLAASLLCGACVPATSGKTSSTDDAPAPAAPSFRVAETPAPQATKMIFERPPVEGLSRVGCRFDLAHWSEAQVPLNLYLGTGKGPWGVLTSSAAAPVSVAIEDGWGLGVVDVQQAGAKVRSMVHADELRLHLRRATVLDGFVIPLPMRALAVEEIEDGNAQVSIFAGPEFATHAWVRTNVRCDELSLGVASYVPKVMRVPTKVHAWLGATNRVSLRRDESGPVVAELMPDEDLLVDVIAKSGTRSRIRWSHSDLLFFGWVETSALGPDPGGISLTGIGQGLGGQGPRIAPQPLAVRCRKALPLIVWQRGRARTVGTIEPDARIDASLMLGELRAVDIRGLDVELRDGGFYTIAADIPKHCVSVPE